MDLANLHRHLRYDPLTGVFSWRISKRGHRRAGDVAGSLTGKGYWRVKVCQVAYLAHRLAWAMHYGVEPAGEVDHRDGNPLNNRIANLRLATRQQNCENVKGAGVRFEAERGKWLARICVKRRQINLGRYDTEAEARAAYEAAKVAHRGDFARVA